MMPVCSTRFRAVALARMAYGIMKQYKLSADSVSKSTGVSKANLAFIRVHGGCRAP